MPPWPLPGACWYGLSYVGVPDSRYTEVWVCGAAVRLACAGVRRSDAADICRLSLPNFSLTRWNFTEFSGIFGGRIVLLVLGQGLMSQLRGSSWGSFWSPPGRVEGK